MSHTVTMIFLGLITACFTSMLTYIVTNLTQRGNTAKIIADSFKTHARIYHKKDITQEIDLLKRDIKQEIKEDIEVVSKSVEKAHTTIEELKNMFQNTALVLEKLKISQSWIVIKLNGDPKEFNL